jgi:hypothetical protein
VPDVLTKRKTVGLDPKVPVQAVATIIVFVASYFAIDLDPGVALALATVLGAGAGIVAPAPKTVATS